ncbi:MAG: GGDEF domain-containing response regulator, partial [Pseudomonadota bacterium]
MLNILVLDDDPDDAFLIIDTLDEVTTTDYRCVSCATPADALSKLAEQRFDLLICDYRLGPIKGTDFIASLERNGHTLPSILLTGMANEEADRLALAAGAADFVSKGDMNAALLDRTIRFAVANAERQAMLSGVINSVTAAICVTDEHHAPSIWNPHFTALAASIARDDAADGGVEALAARAIEGKADDAIPDAVMDTSVTILEDGRCLITMHDVTDHARNAERLDYMTRHCELTGLPNRTALTERLEEATRRAISLGESVALLNIDLDRFKEVNDLYGHQMGDALLIEASRRMSRACASTDYAGRMGGDEFLIVSQAKDNGQSLAARLQQTFNIPFVVNGKLLTIGASIGLATFPDHGATTGDLLSNADTAMFRAKRDATVSVVRFNAEIDEQAREKRRMIVALRGAIERGEIDVDR